AVIGMAALGLNAPDRQQRFAPDRNQIAAERKCKQRRIREPELAGADEDHALVKVALHEQFVDATERDLERERDMIGEDQRPGTGAAFPTIDRDEVDATIAERHQADELLPEPSIADSRLDADRQAGLASQRFHEVEKSIDVMEGRVR